MELFVTLNGRERKVFVEAHDAVFTVAMEEGRVAKGCAQPTGENSISLLLEDGRCFEVSADWLSREDVMISLHDGVYSLTVVDALRKTAELAPVSGGLTVLSAPIPGKVLRVSVAAGDRVQKRQSLMSLEAMKMENDIQAPRDALVEKVMVSQGQSVSAGTTLIVLR